MCNRVSQVFLLLCTSALVQATETTLVVVNARSPISKSAGEYYARKRSVPAKNVCFVQTSAEESISREVYLREIERPIAECLRSRGLAESVLYIVTTAGVPLRVRGRTGLDGDNASVDSELTLLYSRLKGKQFPQDGIVPNPFFGKISAVFRHPDFPIYLVTRLAAFDFNGIRSLIDRALIAKNIGRFVIDAKGGIDEPGDNWLKDAAIRLPSARTLFDESPRVLMREKGVIGYASWGSNDGQRTQRQVGFEWLPGAIMTEFVSTNARTFARPPLDWNISPNWKNPAGWFAGAPQTLITDYIEEGVTGAAGHVDEPYLGLTPRPDYLLPAYYSGRNLAESYYLAIPALSWQNVVVGDPVCSLGRPTAR